MQRTPKDTEKVSIILPTCGRYELVIENINNINKQNYSNFEIVVCDDSEISYLKNNRKLLEELQTLPRIKYNYTARYNHEGVKTYGLATARNTGVIDADGSILVFLDDRISPDTDKLISIFAKKITDNWDTKIWYFGDKGAQKTSFVENCSAIRRRHLIFAGMFCERIEKYGGMTKELSTRFTQQGFKFEYVPEALAKALTKSRDRDKKEIDTAETKKMLKRMGY